MAESVVKKVRMDPPRAAKLRRLARQLKMTESDVLREGLDLVDRVDARRRNIHKLIEMIEGPEPPKIRFRLK